jgi:hypothetical protein
MGWQTDGNLNFTQKYWTYNSLYPLTAGPGGMYRTAYGPSATASLWYVDTFKTFNPNKNYQFRTTVKAFKSFILGSPTPIDSDGDGKFLELITPWGMTFVYSKNQNAGYSGRQLAPVYPYNPFIDTRPSGNTLQQEEDLVFFSSPSSEITSNDMVEYKTTYDGFSNIYDSGSIATGGTPIINEFKIVELDWFIQGWALSQKSNGAPHLNHEGWSYDDVNDKFYWTHDRYGNLTNNPSLITEGSGYANYGVSTASITDGSGWGLSLTYSVGLDRGVNPAWEFYDNNFNGGSVGFIGTTDPSSNFSNGDLVFIVQDNPYTNESYEGYAIITSIQNIGGGNWRININKPFGSNTPAEGGIIVKAQPNGLQIDANSLKNIDLSNSGQGYLSGEPITIPGLPDPGGLTFTIAQAEIDDVGRDTGSSTSRQSVGGHTGSNYISRYIDFATLNLSFTFVGQPDSKLDLYLLPSLPTNDSVGEFNNALSNGEFIGSIINNGPYTFYNLVGNQYLFMTADYKFGDSNFNITNIKFEGSYQENDNNEQFLFTDSGIYSEPTELCIIGGSDDATYSVIVTNEDTLHETVGTGSTPSTFFGATGFPGFFSNLYGEVVNLNALTSKVGNGRFKSGVWENGVWNSGWRVDSEVYEFDDVELSLLMKTTNTIWRIQIKGPKTSLVNFKVGDRVSIGNIVGIDINENRKLMKNYFTVLSVSDKNIVVDFNNTFPLRRIEKDSENHKIKISKNIWLNGGFLNGYFEGIWNSGLFKGFPFITEMYNTHWIDGKYDGGHFYGEYPEYTYVDTYYISNNQYSLGLTFGATAHGFEIGDLISIDKDDKGINIQYDGESTVIDVIDDYMILVDKNFGAASTLEGGTARRRTGTAVIQNFEFYDNNVAEQTTLDTDNLQGIYRYNSWVDVKWLDESATNLGRKQIIYDGLFGEKVQNNLYGRITEDVLDSASSFRNSHNLSKTIYSLGTKYKFYEDFIGDSSEFNEPFPSKNGFDNFYNNGWTYSKFNLPDNDIDIKRDDTTESLLIHMDPALPFIPFIPTSNKSIFDLDNTNVTINRNRYSIIEFDLNYFDAVSDEGFAGYPGIYLLNTIDRPSDQGGGKAFPDQEFVYHTRTESTKKYEYFYNRKGLDLLLLNNGEVNPTGLTASFDNIKIYEIDKAPFFKYITYDYVNKAVEVPYQGIAPFIDYTDNEFSFIDNINIGFDSLSTQQSFNPPTGGGGGGDNEQIFGER